MRISKQNRPLLLLIDDSTVEQRLLVELLTGQQYRLAIAVNGMDGYRKALLNLPDLILLDVQMPGMDGFCVCRMLKSNSMTRHIPIIFLTSRNEPNERLEGLMLGAVDYIPKPFSTEEEVLMRVQLHLNNTQQFSQKNSQSQVVTDISHPTAPDTTQSMLVKVALEYLLKDLANAPSPSELARMVGTNETTLNDAFRKELNCPIFAYLREERLRRARHLLSETEIPIRAIGEFVGYVHSGNFTTAFRLRFGATPREFRTRIRNEKERNTQ